MWHERKVSPFRILKKTITRTIKHDRKYMLKKLDKEYLKFVANETLYPLWIAQNEEDIFQTTSLEYSPLVSIITQTYNTEAKYLKKMLESVVSQTYKNWEFCIADDASTNKKTVQILQDYEKKHKNIKIAYRKTNGHISEATNTAIELANGEYLAFLDHDDMLAPNALYEMVKKLNENRELKLIYSDEDKIDENDNRHSPHFKSGWNPDMFFSQNYICHLTLIKKEVVGSIGGFRKEYEGSQDYDMLLRALEYVEYSQIDRVEKILYHCRVIQGSTAYQAGAKSNTHLAGLKALQDYFAKKDKAITVEDGLLQNTYKVNYPLPTPTPLVSILIPTRDGYDILSKCIESIYAKTLYPNYEIIVIDNETTCKRTLNYFKKIKTYKNLTILEYRATFNYSAINNYAVAHAKGDVIVLMNNDAEVISQGWLIEMMQHVMREEIGAVGAKLYYDNDTVQHAGVILGLYGCAGHSHKHFLRDADGYFGRLKIIQNYSAVTAACLAVRKKLYEEVGGLEEEHLTVAFNDVDFCIKILQKGYRNLWTPYAELYHHESISRGANDTPQKKERAAKEVAYMRDKWLSQLQEDKMYNHNLTKKNEIFGINI
ncbi:MAG: glycosyltransferase [Sulfurimonas sp.]|nr:glycosyltransferase [Sulfurimonas sp.]